MEFKVKIGNDVVEVTNSFNGGGSNIAVVVPYRYSKGREDSVERIEILIERIRDEVNEPVVIVDSGSPAKISSEVKNICLRKNATYAYLDTSGEMFSAGKARDIGAIISDSKCLFFQDIDLLSYKGFYEDLLGDVKDLDSDPNDIKVFPCFYLSEKESGRFKEENPDALRELYYEKYLIGDAGILNAAVFSSAMLVNRMHFLSIGGHDPDFFGHGFEDFELMNRLANIDNRFVRPINYYHDGRSWSPTKYEGFRAYFRCYGEKALAAKRYLVHIFHDSVELPFDFVNKNKSNRVLLERKMKDFDRNRVCPIALPDLSCGKTLCIGDYRSAFYKSINYALPYFGVLDFVDENQFETAQQCVEYFQKIDSDRVLMPNPYGNERRLAIYRCFKEAGTQVVVCDRGGLDKSHFFDHGFNSDSLTYAEEVWDKPLDADELASVDEYILEEKVNEHALENQPPREASNAILEKLKIHQNKKILFVPFQRPNDTVVKYFSDEIGGMPGFYSLVSNVAASLGQDWVVLCKKHPLEDSIDFSTQSNVIVIGDECHFKDLINLSEAVLLINSGVGLYGMMYEKPIMVAGDAYYAHYGLVTKVRNAEDVLAFLNEPVAPDSVKIKRFIFHLVNHVYSFGDTFNTISHDSSGKRIRVARYIDFEDLKILGENVVKRTKRAAPIYTLKSPLFDRYRYWVTSVKGKQNPVTAPQVKPSASLPVRGENEGGNHRSSKTIAAPESVVKNKTFKRKLRKLIRDPKLFFEDRAKKKKALNR